MLSRKKKNIITQVQTNEPPLPFPPPVPTVISSRSSINQKQNNSKPHEQLSFINYANNSGKQRLQNQNQSQKNGLVSSTVASSSYGQHVGVSGTGQGVRGGSSRSAVPYFTQEELKGGRNQSSVVVSKDAIVNGIIPRLGTLICTENDLERTRELRRLLICLNDWEIIDDQTLLKLIEGLKANVDSLNDKMGPLIQRILDSNWAGRPNKIIRSMENFVSELLVVRPNYCGQVMRSMVVNFMPIVKSLAGSPDEIPLSEQRLFAVAHRNLQRVLESFPMMKESCGKTMEAVYPYMGKGPHIHYCFVNNLIQAIRYLPQCRMQILHLIIHKLSRIDVNIPREDVEEMNERMNCEPNNKLTKIKKEEGGHEDLPMDSESGGSDVHVSPLANILDLCLSLVFEYFDSDILMVSEENNSLADLETIFESLCSTFEKEILPTFSLNHVQFLFFYYVSFRPEFSLRLLEFLWKRASCVNSHAVIRIQSMAYISGFLSRASFISIKTVKRWLTRLTDWANVYVDEKVKSCHWSSVNIQAHGPFYAVCQTIFYVFAFRNKELIGSRKCVAFTRTLNLGRLVTCDLNPLKACVETVAEAFVNAAHVHQISYCRTVLERNQRATIPTIVAVSLNDLGEEAAANAASSLECFFPLDPYLLPRSRKWIDPIYATYEAYLPEVKIEKQETPWSPQEEDSIEMELSVSFNENGSSFLSSGMMNTSDIKDDTMEDYID